MTNSIPTEWHQLLSDQFDKAYFKSLAEAVDFAYKTTTVYPARKNLFRALSLCKPDMVKVVILGQDPYHEPGQADGLAFSVPSHIKVPGSLRHIYDEIALERQLLPHCFTSSSTGIPQPDNLLKTASGYTSLESWAHQGVLLLNATLSVERGKAGSHNRIGWQQFTDAIISAISAHTNHTVFLLWGNNAAGKTPLIDNVNHHVLTATHPSGLSWGKTSNSDKKNGHHLLVMTNGHLSTSDIIFDYNGFGRLRDDSFWGCMHFASTNQFLTAHSKTPITWL